MSINQNDRPSVQRPSLQNDGPGLKYHVRVHSFRVFTVILAWVLVIAAFYERPELLTGAQRLIQHGVEGVGDSIPPPWGPRIEFVFREIGGLIWLQITLLVVLLRMTLTMFGITWRFLRRNRSP